MPQHYYRRSSNPLANVWHGSAVKKIIIVNAAVFLLQLILRNTAFTDLLALHPKQVLTRGYIWQLVTHMFLHGGFFHLALNMFVVWMFGTPLESVWGSKRFLTFYFVCGLGGAALGFVFYYNAAAIGASGACYGILLAFAVLFPHNIIYIWGLVPIKARTFVIIITFIELYYGVSVRDGIAHFAHLGGMAAGLIYLRSDYRTRRLWNWFDNIWKKIPIKIEIDRKDKGEEESDPNKIDSILDKISSKGYENLTETEKRILDNYSKNTEKH